MESLLNKPNVERISHRHPQPSYSSPTLWQLIVENQFIFQNFCQSFSLHNLCRDSFVTDNFIFTLEWNLLYIIESCIQRFVFWTPVKMSLPTITFYLSNTTDFARHRMLCITRPTHKRRMKILSIFFLF